MNLLVVISQYFTAFSLKTRKQIPFERLALFELKPRKNPRHRLCANKVFTQKMAVQCLLVETVVVVAAVANDFAYFYCCLCHTYHLLLQPRPCLCFLFFPFTIGMNIVEKVKFKAIYYLFETLYPLLPIYYTYAITVSRAISFLCKLCPILLRIRSTLFYSAGCGC